MNKLDTIKFMIKRFSLIRVLNLILIIFIISQDFTCTNYSVSKSKTVPPILVSIAKISGTGYSGYQIKMRVTNQEPFFAGYKLYVGTDENGARNPSDLNSGEDCTNGPVIIPNQPIEYVIEVSADPTTLPGTGNRLCTYKRTLNAGEFIALRTLLVSIQPSNQGGNRINPSLPSNTLVVP